MIIDFNNMRYAGVKCVLRFSYSDSDNRVICPVRDVAKARLLLHIGQLSSVTSQYQDIISSVEAGFIGVWGEWAFSDNYGNTLTDILTDTNLKDRKEIGYKIMELAPLRKVAFRTPRYQKLMLGQETPQIINNYPTNFDPEFKKRIAAHNDCFLSSLSNGATYGTGNQTITQDRDWLEEQTNINFNGGETCNNNTLYTNATNAYAELKRFHFNYLNSAYYGEVVNPIPLLITDPPAGLWANTPYVTISESANYLEEIRKKLGYRFKLLNSNITSNTVVINLQNIGFANVINPRKAYLVLKNNSNNVVAKVEMTGINGTDVRNWDAATTTIPAPVVSLSKDLSGYVCAGTYNLFLEIPDLDRPTDTNYSVRMANNNIGTIDFWDSVTGFNNLYRSITIINPATPVITGSVSACTASETAKQTINSTILLPGQTASWSIGNSGVGTFLNGSNTNSTALINWTTLPGQIILTVSDASGVCSNSVIQDINILCDGVSANDVVYTTKLQSDGKIIFGGNFTSYGGNPSNRIARLKTDMTYDNTFVVGIGANGTILASAIQADGKIIIGGYFTTYNGVSSNGIARLNSNGSLDTAFLVTSGFGSGYSVNAIAIQADGKIIVGGSFDSYNGTIKKNIVRINTNGTVDTAFNSSFSSSTDVYVYCIAIQTDGKIVLGGNFINYGTVNSPKIVRLLTTGFIDSTFSIGTGFSGYATNPSSISLKSLKLQLDGKILAGGYFDLFNGITRKYLARLNTNGSLDTTFIPDSISFPAGGGGVNTIDLQADNKIIIGGGFMNIGIISCNRIARLSISGILDSTFNIGTGFGPPIGNRLIAGILYSLNVQPDGKFVTGGRFSTYNNIGINNLTRLNPTFTGAIGRYVDNKDTIKNNIKVYPNPLSDYFIISSPYDNVDFVEIYDVTGKLVKSQSIISSDDKVSMVDLQKATYYLKIYNKSNLLKSTILIKH